MCNELEKKGFPLAQKCQARHGELQTTKSHFPPDCNWIGGHVFSYFCKRHDIAIRFTGKAQVKRPPESN